MLKAPFVNNWKMCASDDIHFSLRLKKTEGIFNAYFEMQNQTLLQ